MRFRFLLWRLGSQLASASRRDGEFRRHLFDHQLIFQLRSADGRTARHFLVADQRILPLAGSCPFADLDVVFSDDRWGCRALNPRSRHQAFFEGVDAQTIRFHGNPALMLWLQGLLDGLEHHLRAPRQTPAGLRRDWLSCDDSPWQQEARPRAGKTSE